MKQLKSSSSANKFGFIKSVFLSRYTILLISVLGVFHLGGLAGGRLVPFTIGLLVCSIISAYFGFFRKEYVLWRYKAQSGAIIGFILTYGMAYISGLEQNGIDIISQQVVPYPNISRITVVPRISNDMIWGWLVDTPDSADKVVSFYNDKKNIKDWMVKEASVMIFLEKGKYKLTISPTNNQIGSKIYYLLEKKKTI